MLNSVQLMGRLTREPELKRTRSGTAVCTITLAVDRDYVDENGVREADFIDVVTWRGTAEHVCRWFRKGLLVAVTGRLQSRRWTDQYNQSRVSWEVIAESVYFAERADGQRAGGDAPPHQSAAATSRAANHSQDGSPAAATPQRGSHGPRSDLKAVDASRADVETDGGGDYTGDLYRGGLPHSEFEEYDDDGDVPF